MTVLLRALAFACLLGAALPAAPAIQLVAVDRPEINMREGPGTTHPKLWVLTRGYPLQVIGRQGGWLKVRDFERDTGWVLARLTARKPHLVVKVDRANLRRGPGTRHARVGVVVYGEALRTLERRGDWVRVKPVAGGPTGWVARRLVWGW